MLNLDHVIAEIERLAAATDDAPEKQKFLSISEYLKHFSHVFTKNEAKEIRCAYLGGAFPFRIDSQVLHAAPPGSTRPGNAQKPENAKHTGGRN